MEKKNPDTYFLSENNLPFEDFFHFGLSVDCIIFGYHQGSLRVLLIQRGAEPFKDSWAIPGDLVNPSEDLTSSASRVLKQLTGLTDIPVQQFHTFGSIDRHPVGRVITVGYYALVRSENHHPIASTWASNVKWFDVYDLPSLAFDHEEILTKAVETLRTKVRKEPVGFDLLPPKFTLLELQGMYEALLRERFDKPNFRKKILGADVLVPLDEVQKNVSHRPAKLFHFDKNRYESQKKQLFNF
ncbi:MAG: NUDIX hydrolase [Bacteroidia bacterium]|nr:NUDIX hydrolase [Bacteroidia bacterium]